MQKHKDSQTGHAWVKIRQRNAVNCVAANKKQQGMDERMTGTMKSVNT
jgi:hypothetical protein